MALTASNIATCIKAMARAAVGGRRRFSRRMTSALAFQSEITSARADVIQAVDRTSAAAAARNQDVTAMGFPLVWWRCAPSQPQGARGVTKEARKISEI